MIQPHDRRDVSGISGRDAPWRRVGSVMIVTANVAVISLALRGFVGTETDTSAHVVWASLAIALGLAASWTGRGVLAWVGGPDLRGPIRGCARCGRPSLLMLTRTRPGHPPVWVGARCAGCGTTYRRVDGRIVAFSPSTEPGSDDGAGIRFDDESVQPDDVRFLDEAPG